MDNKKFESLIDLIINENEEQARALFHDIVVEKSREIYESMMSEDDMMNSPSGQVQDLLDEISSEEEGMAEAEDDDMEMEFGDDDGDEEVIDIDTDEMGEEEPEELEDRVVDLEDKLDQLMAEFEDIMGGEGEEDHGESDAEFDDEAEEDGEDLTHDMEQEHDDVEEAMMEAIQLKKVPGLYGSKIGGDSGTQTKSPVSSNSGQKGMASRPVNFDKGTEANPTGPKSPSAYTTKGESTVKGAGSFKNAPGAKFSEKGESTPKPVTKDSAPSTKSPVAEARRTVKRRI